MIILGIIGVIIFVGFAIGAFVVNSEEKKYGRRD